MDKLLIALGGYIIYKVANNTQNDITSNMNAVIKTEGMLGMLLIFAILLSFAQYAGKSLTWIPASLSVIIALGFWANKGV
jgi:hypothetical protein